MVPIIFISPEDPVRLGLVASLAKPGGNLSGINLLSGELVAKRLELLRELVPQIVRVAVLVNPANPSTTETALRDVVPAARAMGLQTQTLEASTSRDATLALNERGKRLRTRLVPRCIPQHARPLGSCSLVDFLAISGRQNDGGEGSS